MPRSGEVIDDRFLVEHLAGTGGMAQVYRARDRRSGALVALKVMHDAEDLEIERFAREARVLADLSHPGVVRYIDSGTTADGEPYLVMEWLSGETLATRLHRTQITLAASLALGRRVASALGAVHRRGVVHRDVKPSNLFLRGSAIEEVTLIDFGMARRSLTDPKLTVTGTMLGTPGYVAPEQVYNVSNLDGRADIFSLGCVLYRCLSGRAPFQGHDALRMLLNGTPDELPRLRELRPSIPRQLDELVARMLSKSPDDRPHSADAVAAELLAIEESEISGGSARSSSRNVLSEILSTERRLMSLVVARPPDRPHSLVERDGQERTLRAAVERHRGKLEIFVGGSLLAILSNADAATDLAVRAARCALAIQRVLGKGSVAVVTGQEILGPGLPDSELLGRAVDLLESTARGAAVRIDELTSALLDDRFDTGSTGLHLRGELRDGGGTRLAGEPAAGEPAACLGRDQEIAWLEAIFDQCVEERAASLALVTAPAGAGKSCLGRELLRRLGARDRPVTIWLGEADPLNAGAELALLAQVLRGVGGPLDGGPQASATPAPEGEQLAQTFLGLLRAACAAQPVLLVLEDLHWGDLPTIKVVGAALDELSDQPLMVLALARTEVHEIFPQLRADRRVQELRLRKLSRRASEQRVRQVLGDAVDDETVRSLVERSEGHAFYLEQMIRAVAEGKGAATPPTVLAMIQARIERLDPAARRVLRAASIFGETFWRGGVEALLGGGDTAAWLAELVEQDLVAIRDDARFAGEVELCFPHALVREAAYGMLTEGDLVAGHWLAGQWLEQAGETDPAVLKEHFERCERGGGPDRSR
jgi:hypothetical protein